MNITIEFMQRWLPFDPSSVDTTTMTAVPSRSIIVLERWCTPSTHLRNDHGARR
jgi:hypothetical protein